MTVGNEAQPCNKTPSDPGGDLDINREFIQHSFDHTSEGKVQEGIKDRGSNNLAGIVISSGPGGHFETFEGIKIFKYFALPYFTIIVCGFRFIKSRLPIL